MQINNKKSLISSSGKPTGSYLLFQFQNELPRAPPAALGLVDAFVIQQHPLRRLGGGGLLRAHIFGHFLHQDVVAWIGVGEDAVGILGLR